MKLSEAIRLGATLKPQGFHRSLYDGTTCAIGAALDAMGALKGRRSVLTYPHGISLKDFGWGFAINKRPARCHLCDCFIHKYSLSIMIQHWNDAHRLSRQEIADLIEKYEPQETPVETPEIKESEVVPIGKAE